MNDEVSKLCLEWKDNKQEVIGQLYKIIRQAFGLHKAREMDPAARNRMIDEFFHRDEDEEGSSDNYDDSDDDDSGDDEDDEDESPW